MDADKPAWLDDECDIPGTIDPEAPEHRERFEKKAEGDALPRITCLSGRLPLIADEAEAAMIAAGVPYYQRGGLLVRPVFEAIKTADGGTDKARRLVPVTRAQCTDAAMRAASFGRRNAKGDWLPCDVPPRVIDVLLSREGGWRFPTLQGIVTAPTLRADGSILDRHGFDEASGLLFIDDGARFPAIPDRPTKDQAIAALGELRGLIATFPFVSPADRAVMLAAILTALVRRSLPTAPLFGFGAPSPGSGKSLLVDCVSMIASGHKAAVIALGQIEEETEKRLASALLAGDAIVALDNVTRPFGGDLACQVLTQERVKVRPLGQSRLVEIPANALMTVTGNNLRLKGDLCRRALLCAIDAKCERPEKRTFANHPLEIIANDRGRFVRTVLTVLRAFHVAGRPRQATPLGSFEPWSNWVRGALLWCGEADPCETMERVRANDPEAEELGAVMTQWAEVIGVGEKVTTRELIEKATRQYTVVLGRAEFEHPEFREALLTAAGSGGAINGRRLGNWLAEKKDRPMNGAMIVQAGERQGVALWRLAVTQGVSVGLEGSFRPVSNEPAPMPQVEYKFVSK